MIKKYLKSVDWCLLPIVVPGILIITLLLLPKKPPEPKFHYKDCVLVMDSFYGYAFAWINKWDGGYKYNVKLINIDWDKYEYNTYVHQNTLIKEDPKWCEEEEKRAK